MATKLANLFDDMKPRQPQNWTRRIRKSVGNVIFNLIPLVIVGVFFWIQVQIGAQGDGWLTKFEIGLTVLFELALVFVWSLFVEGH